MNQYPWPKWATVKAEEARLLAPEERGPWQDNGTCDFRTTREEKPHAPDGPYLFYCVQHMAEVREKNTQVKPNPRRDQGLCRRCGNPAKLKPRNMAETVAALEAERTGNTIARMRTSEFCGRCQESIGTWCRGEICRAAGDRRRVRRTGCCPDTRTGKQRHCLLCCDAGKDKLRGRGKRARPNKAGTALGKTHTGQLTGNRAKAGRISRAGASVPEIALALKTSKETVRIYMQELEQVTAARSETLRKRGLEQRETIAKMLRRCARTDIIAKRTGLAEKTVEKYISEIQKEAGRRLGDDG